MEIRIEPGLSFECPEGHYTATLIEIKPVEKPGRDPMIRLLFEIKELSDEYTTVVVGKNYLPVLSKTSDLHHDLCTWLGNDYLKIIKTENGHNLDTLLQQDGDLTIVHVANKNYPKPFVSIQGIYPPGTLTSNGYRDQKDGI